MLGNWEILLRLVLSVVCGGIVGYQREAVDRPAGFRTHVLVCLGSALITVVSIDGFKGADPARVAAQIVTGIGFLGAGTIIRQGSVVRGLTTAASIWAVAGVGIGIGSGYYPASVFATVLMFVVLSAGKKMETDFISRATERALLVRTIMQPGQVGKIDNILEKEGINIRAVEFKEESDEEALVKINLSVPPNINFDIIKLKIAEIPGVSEVSWENNK